MNGTYRPLTNDQYGDKYGEGNLLFPTWWLQSGGRLVPLESGIGARVHLQDFRPMYPWGCDYFPHDYLADFDPTAFKWRFWVYGHYNKAVDTDCYDLFEYKLNQFLFYAHLEGLEPTPGIEDTLIGTNIPEITADRVSVYVTREMTQRMNIGMFYLGVVVVDDINDPGTPDLTPAQKIAGRPKLPPLWLFMQDSERNFHGRFEDIPGRRKTLCP